MGATREDWPPSECEPALTGRTLGEFVAGERIGAGGFGEVYRARQPALDRDVVVKVLRLRHRATPNARERFLREARLLSRIDHPFAAHVYAYGAEPDGVLWIAMELVVGTPLDALLREQGPVPLDRFVPFLERLAEVVHTAHERRIVHRDIKPANVMVLVRAGQYLPKLLDLGIGRLLEEERQAPAVPDGALMTDAGTMLGTPAYMAPEVWDGAAEVDARADQYSLAVLCYQAISGRLPFTGQGRALMDAHRLGAVPPLPPTLPAELGGVLARALAKLPGQRFPTVLAFAEAFRVASGVKLTDDLPRLEAQAAARALVHAPQPIAEAVAGLEAAHSAHQVRDGVWDVARATTRILAVLAMAAHSRGAAPPPPEAIDLLRALRGRELDDGEWLALARALAGAAAAMPEAHPLPDLVRWLGDPEARGGFALDRLIQLHRASQARALTDAQVRELLDEALPALREVLEGLALLDAYPLVVPGRDGAERWTGVRRSVRARFALRGEPVPRGRPIVARVNGTPLLALWPLVQVEEPAQGVPDELFLLDGPGRGGARLVARPHGFERNDPAVWRWLGERFLHEDEDAAPEALETAPYRGLASFGEGDADDYFGRERDVEGVLNRLRAQPLITVVGPSGAGKTSFLHAGVLPRLPQGWRSVLLRPGHEPLKTLAWGMTRRAGRATLDADRLRAQLREQPASLAELVRGLFADGVTVIVVDQLEELLTLCQDAGERQAFTEALVAASRAEGCRVILALRDDFLTRMDALPALRGELGRHLVLLGTPVGAELRRILVEPARRAGYSFEDGALVDEMVEAVADRPGALALLSFTALRLWEYRDRHFRRLTRGAYSALGGVGGALAQHADATLQALGPSEQQLVRQIFRRLVTAEGTRTTLPRGELAELAARAAGLPASRADEVLESLLAARLLTSSDEDRIEIIHETLLGAWPRLRGWLDDDRAGARLRDQLGAAAQQWHQRGRPRGLLWRDDALAELRAWRARHALPLSTQEGAFAAASVQEAARVRLRRTSFLALAFAGLAAAVAGLLVLNRTSERARRAAERATGAADARLADLIRARGRELLLAGDARRALPLLVDLYRRGEDQPALRYLLARAAGAVEAERSVLRHGGRVHVAVFSPRGDRVLTTSDDHLARIWDAETGAPLVTLAGHTAEVVFGRFSPDGERVATASWDHTARIWDARDGRPLLVLHHQDRVRHLAWSPDGRFLAALGYDPFVLVWDAATGAAAARLTANDSQLYNLAFSPDGATLLTTSYDRAARLWDWRRGRVRAVLAHESAVLDGDFSPDGTLVATAGRDRVFRLWRAADGAPLLVGRGHAGEVKSVRFSPDARSLVTVSDDATARVWRLPGGEIVSSLVGHRGEVRRAAFSPDGTRVATASTDGTARLWDVRSGKTLAVFAGHDDMVWGVTFDPSGRRVATASYDGTARLWDATRHALLLSITGHGERVRDVVFSPDGTRIASASEDQTARIWDAATGKELMRLPHPAWVATVRFRPDGRRLLTGSYDGTLRLWDAESGALLRTMSHPKVVWSAHYRGDGLEVVTSANDGAVRLWEPETGVQLRELRTACDPGSADFSPDGRHLATGCADGATMIWDLGSAAPPRRIAGHRNAVIDAHFSADGTRLVTAGEDPEARVWDARTGAPIATLAGHVNQLKDAGFSPEGALVVTASLDGTARVWDAETGSLLGVYPCGGWVNSAAFSPDGRRVATSGASGVIDIWDAHLEERSPAALAALIEAKGLRAHEP